jgi:hypothetical protein
MSYNDVSTTVACIRCCELLPSNAFIKSVTILYALYNTLDHLVDRQWSEDHSLINVDLRGCEFGMLLE